MMASEEGNEGRRRMKLNAKWKHLGETGKGGAESRMLIGKILSDKNINKKAVVTTIRKGWNLGEDTEIMEMKDDSLVFSFPTMKDKERMLRGRPWTFQGAIMSIQEWSEYMVVDDVSFDKIPFWVQFHNLPLGLLEEEVNVQNMGELVGELVWYEKPKLNGKFNRSYGRARVLIDVKEPLVAGFHVERPGLPAIWVSVKYERLQAFCFKCGKMGHDFRGCKEPVTEDEKGERLYGAWMTTAAEKDVEEALVKFSTTWGEEDCRKGAVARALLASPARGDETGGNQKGETLGQVLPTSARTEGRPEKTRLDQSMSEGQSELEDGLLKGKVSSSHDLDLMGPTVKAQAQTVGPLTSLGTHTSQTTAVQEPAQTDNCDQDPNLHRVMGSSSLMSSEPIGYSSVGPTRAVQLSPISEVAQKIKGCTLKREAEDPTSPTQSKKRRLFVETEEPQRTTTHPTTSRKKNARQIKGDIRRRSGTKGDVKLKEVVPLEIDFPAEWMVVHETQKQGNEAQVDANGLGGCPPTATGQP